jgi:hypothetical protein
MLDATSPEPFALELVRPDSNQATQVLIWNADDRTSGVVESVLTVGRTRLGAATSPLRIQSSWHGQSATVAAVDAAGNRRTAELILGPASDRTWPTWWLALGAAVLIGALAVVMIRARQHT